ncbi:hypothetical protein CsSME_00011492 [Camellia sinensis var. sinensis]
MYKELPLALEQVSREESELDEYNAASSLSELEFSIFTFFIFMFGRILDFSVIGKLFTKFT